MPCFSGDWGGIPVFPYRTVIEQAVASSISSLAKKYDTQFQLALGDNFYTNGVTDEFDKRFKVNLQPWVSLVEVSTF